MNPAIDRLDIPARFGLHKQWFSAAHPQSFISSEDCK
jgi:hypothetical protein